MPASFDKIYVDIGEARDALATYWSRSPQNQDEQIADLHLAAEAIMRALGSLAIAVDRIDIRLKSTEWEGIR